MSVPLVTFSNLCESSLTYHRTGSDLMTGVVYGMGYHLYDIDFPSLDAARDLFLWCKGTQIIKVNCTEPYRRLSLRDILLPGHLLHQNVDSVALHPHLPGDQIPSLLHRHNGFHDHRPRYPSADGYLAVCPD